MNNLNEVPETNLSSTDFKYKLGIDEKMYIKDNSYLESTDYFESSSVDEEIYGVIRNIDIDSDETLLERNQDNCISKSTFGSQLDIQKLCPIDEELEILKRDDDIEIYNNRNEIFEESFNENTIGMYTTIRDISRNFAKLKALAREEESNISKLEVNSNYDDLVLGADNKQQTLRKQIKNKFNISQLDNNKQTKHVQQKSNQHAKSEIKSIDENLELLRRDNESYALRRKKIEIQELLTNSQIFNGKLKNERDIYSKELAKYKSTLFDTLQDTKTAIKLGYDLEDQNARLNERIAKLTDEIEKLKVEMIEKLLAANSAKRVLANTETALSRISNAYEHKRNEAKSLMAKIEQSESAVWELRSRWKSFVETVGSKAKLKLNTVQTRAMK